MIEQREHKTFTEILYDIVNKNEKKLMFNHKVSLTNALIEIAEEQPMLRTWCDIQKCPCQIRP